MHNNPIPTDAKPKRIDLYVDESGQDTKGEIFVVGIVAVKNSDKFRQHCESLERTSRKGPAKWGKANRNNRLIYLRTIVSDDRFRDFLLFSYLFQGTKDYVGSTTRGIDLAVASLQPSDSSVYVYIDGLVKTQYKNYQVRLRKLGCHVEKVRGRKDQNEPLIRLADAVAGATRDLLEYENSELKELFSLAMTRDIFVGGRISTNAFLEPSVKM